MPTNLAIDDRLLEEAQRLGQMPTKKATVNQALAEFVARRKQKKVVALFGQIDWESTYDYKKERRRR